VVENCRLLIANSKICNLQSYNLRLPAILVGMKFTILLSILLMPLILSAAPHADLIIINADVYTVDAARPHAEAIAILQDKIVAVGNVKEANSWRGPNTKVIDAGGRLVLPGFNDSHVHFLSGGMQLTNVQLKDASSREEFVRRVAERAKNTEEGEWVVGGDWDDQNFVPTELPTRQWIDDATPNRPVFVSRYDGHMALANSLALKMAGITSQTSDPPGGMIVRDSKGNPTGVLKDAAMSAVYKVIPPLSHRQRKEIIERAMAHAASVGVTSVQDMNPEFADMALYSEMAEKGELTLRVYAAPIETEWESLAKIGLRRNFGSNYYRTGALKGFADGSLGSSTAYFFEPFLDDPQNHGLLSDEMIPIEKIRERLTNADRAGLQICMHAIGDQAISIILDIFADIVKANGEKDRRFRIEHAQHMAQKDFQRFADLHVIASVQPYHAIDDGRWAEKRIGSRIKTTYAFRTFLDHGVKLALGTDWDVAPLNPMETIYAAVTRATLDGKNPNGWVPEQKLTVAEAVYAYTMGSAYAEFQENEKGSITPGKFADIVILDQDIFHIDPVAIKDVKVNTTIVGGKMVFAP
jgi:predicted amidohydrolase YtcJ